MLCQMRGRSEKVERPKTLGEARYTRGESKQLRRVVSCLSSGVGRYFYLRASDAGPVDCFPYEGCELREDDGDEERNGVRIIV